MATTDDNDSQDSSTRTEIPADNIVNENSQGKSKSPADDAVGMATDDQDSLLPLNLSGPRSESPVPALDNKAEDVNSQSSQRIENNSMEDIQDGAKAKCMREKEEGEDEVGDCTAFSKLTSVSEGSVVSSQDKKIEHDPIFPSEDDNSQSSTCKDNINVADAQNGDGKMDAREEEEDGTAAIKVALVSEESALSSQDQVAEHKQSFPSKDDNNRSIQCKENNSTKDTHIDSMSVSMREEERQDVIKLTSISEGVASSQNQITEQDPTILSEDGETSKPEKEDCEDRSGVSTPQFTTVLNSDDSCDQNSPCPIPQSSSSEVVEGVEKVIFDQDSQSTLADEPPILICSDAECYIRLDEETFKEWNETRRKMGFDSDPQMAKFLMRRLAVHGFTEAQSDLQESVQGRSKSQTKPSDVLKKKSTSTGGIESIVRRLHQVRTETGDTSPSQPDSDNDNNVDPHFSDMVKIKTEPEEMCNSGEESAVSASIPKKATTAIYSSGRNGRKRIYVKREPDVDVWGQHQQESPHSNYGGFEPDEQPANVASNDSYWPVRIKQEPVDINKSHMMAGDQNTEAEKPGTLGQFVRNAASWVSHLVASELEKPQETTAEVPDTPESLFSDSRLHKIIEEQLSKTPEPSISEMRLHSVIEKQLEKPVPKVDASYVDIKREQISAEQVLRAQSKAAKKELKRARREARQAKKLKKAQKREKALQKYGEPDLSHSPFERSSSEVSSSPFDKSHSPFNKSRSPFEISHSPFETPANREPVSASHCLESFARMVQIREFQGSPLTPSSLEVQKSPQIQRSPPIPTNLGPHSPAHIPSSQIATTAYSPQPQNSPALNTSNTSPNENSHLASDEHPASLALKSFAQRSVTFVQTEVEDDREAPPYQEAFGGWERSSPRPEIQIDAQSQSTDPLTGSPLEQLLKVSETPHHNTAKSQLEHLLKAKDIKDKWSKPSAYSNQQVPFPAHTSYSTHILKVPKVTFSGRTINDTRQDSYLKAPAIDRVLASTGFSSDSEDSDTKEAKEAKDRNKDPDWSPARRKRPRKRSFPKNVDNSEHRDGVQNLSKGSTACSLQVGNLVINAADKENGEPFDKVGFEPLVKHQKLDKDGAVQEGKGTFGTTSSGDTTAELSATSTLAKLLQMANKNSQGKRSTQNSDKTMSVPPKHGVNAPGNDKRQQTYETPKRNFSPKQSAFGAMQAFAQLVEIQGKTPVKQQSHTEEPLSTPQSNKLSDSLPPITPDETQRQNIDASRGTHSPVRQNVNDQNGAGFRNGDRVSTEVNGSDAHDNNEPEDLTMHSSVRIKIEPQDLSSSIQETRMARKVSKHQHHINLLRKKPMQYTCSLCSQVFPSKTEVTEHKLRIHYSSGCEMVS